jgi:hypothetical protein
LCDNQFSELPLEIVNLNKLNTFTYKKNPIQNLLDPNITDFINRFRCQIQKLKSIDQSTYLNIRKKMNEIHQLKKSIIDEMVQLGYDKKTIDECILRIEKDI